MSHPPYQRGKGFPFACGKERKRIPKSPVDSDSQYLHPHIAIFPFMAKGHTIPLLHLLCLLRRRFPHLSLTIFTTPANRPFTSI
ncbi:hypothetical protein Csa_008442, partial [Cucumis sativus]